MVDRLMMYNETQEESRPFISAHNRLLGNQDFRTYTQRLELSLEKIRQNGDTLTGEALAWNQGACQILQELLNDNERVKNMFG